MQNPFVVLYKPKISRLRRFSSLKKERQFWFSEGHRKCLGRQNSSKNILSRHPVDLQIVQRAAKSNSAFIFVCFKICIFFHHFFHRFGETLHGLSNGSFFAVCQISGSCLYRIILGPDHLFFRGIVHFVGHIFRRSCLFGFKNHHHKFMRFYVETKFDQFLFFHIGWEISLTG